MGELLYPYRPDTKKFNANNKALTTLPRSFLCFLMNSFNYIAYFLSFLLFEICSLNKIQFDSCLNNILDCILYSKESSIVFDLNYCAAGKPSTTTLQFVIYTTLQTAISFSFRNSLFFHKYSLSRVFHIEY